MRVNVYAEEMTDKVEIITKLVNGQEFTAIRFWLHLPASFHTKVNALGMVMVPARVSDTEQAHHMQAPFIHSPGDDDSSAVTFWGKKDMRFMLKKALTLLDKHYAERDAKRDERQKGYADVPAA